MRTNPGSIKPVSFSTPLFGLDGYVPRNRVWFWKFGFPATKLPLSIPPARGFDAPINGNRFSSIGWVMVGRAKGRRFRDSQGWINSQDRKTILTESLVKGAMPHYLFSLSKAKTFLASIEFQKYRSRFVIWRFLVVETVAADCKD